VSENVLRVLQISSKSNRFTLSRVTAERVNTAKRRRKVNPIFGGGLSSSRIIKQNDRSHHRHRWYLTTNFKCRTHIVFNTNIITIKELLSSQATALCRPYAKLAHCLNTLFTSIKDVEVAYRHCTQCTVFFQNVKPTSFTNPTLRSFTSSSRTGLSLDRISELLGL